MIRIPFLARARLRFAKKSIPVRVVGHIDPGNLSFLLKRQLEIHQEIRFVEIGLGVRPQLCEESAIQALEVCERASHDKTVLALGNGRGWQHANPGSSVYSVNDPDAELPSRQARAETDATSVQIVVSADQDHRMVRFDREPDDANPPGGRRGILHFMQRI